jgi:hypothetical protein
MGPTQYAAASQARHLSRFNGFRNRFNGFNSAAHKMNYLDLVPGGQNRVVPFVASHYLLIEFDRNARRRQRQLFDEIGERRPIDHFAAFTI